MDDVDLGLGHGYLRTMDSARIIALSLDNRHPLLAPAQFALYEWTDYWLRYEGATGLRIGERIVKPIDDCLFQVRFENQLGLTHLQPLDDDGPCGSSIPIEVLSPKFPTIDDHIAFLSGLLDDLFARAARLPFSISTDTARGVAESPATPSPLFTLHFIIQCAHESGDMGSRPGVPARDTSAWVRAGAGMAASPGGITGYPRESLRPGVPPSTPGGGRWASARAVLEERLIGAAPGHH